MAKSHMRNLTLASAKHLLSQGHITKPHHDKIVAAASAPGIPKMPTMPKAPTGPFGQLAKKKKQVAAMPPLAPMQAQAPIPGVGGPPVTPPGMASGYDEE